MPTEVILPRVDMTMESGTIESWKVAEGDRVREGDTLFEITTDKAVVEVDAPASGVLRGIKAAPGQEIAVGSVVAWIFADGEAAEIPLQPAAPHAEKSVSGPSTSAPQPVLEHARLPPTNDIRATPLARRVARELGIELRNIVGSGPSGRIAERDVRAYSTRTERPLHEPATVEAGSKLVPFSTIRRTTATRLSESVRTAPHFYLTAHVDMTGLLALQSAVSPAIERRTGVKVTLSVLLTRIVAPLLKDHPSLNASVEGQAMRMHAKANIGIAMERNGDLFVPVIQESQTTSIEAVAVEVDRLRKAVMTASASPSDLRGGTFTISNLGMYGVDAFTAIINPPESAILSVGRIVDTPVGRDGNVVLAPVATFCLSSDHRIVDGVAAARFMADLRQVIENPLLLL